VTAWRWLNSTLIYAIHDRQLAEHGGPDGIRDKGLVESALVRPQNLAAYESPDAADLAAAYAYGLARNHGFVDGNKRTAWIAARVFLADQGLLLAFEKVDAVSTMEKVAAGTLTEPELASWFRDRLRQGT
jgi:death-on-curing protein